MFQKSNFELLFEENITEYINKIAEKIVNIQTLENIIKLVRVDRIKEEKQKDYFNMLEAKYISIIKYEIEEIKI